jgi:mannose-6-phosphate isomerase
MSTSLMRIEGVLRDYEWGGVGGISRVLGRVSDAREAELWLGAHPTAPSGITRSATRHTDLAEWEHETGSTIPFLLKLLSAQRPLSLQAHPTAEHAARGYAKEESAGVPRTARNRNYKDPHAKPELIVALEDGFEALCGFQPVDRTVTNIRQLATLADEPTPFSEWERLLVGADGIRSAFAWLQTSDSTVTQLLHQLSTVAKSAPSRFRLMNEISRHYPGDPGLAIALMLNHVTLSVGEALWLPAGNIHAYLRGTGVELMGPSDNVLRGGMTSKHVDPSELMSVLDFRTAAPSRLTPEAHSAHVVEYRPASIPSGEDVPFRLLSIDGDATANTSGPAIGLVVEGEFAVSVGRDVINVGRGGAFLVTDADSLHLRGEGRMFLAAT